MQTETDRGGAFPQRDVSCALLRELPDRALTCPLAVLLQQCCTEPQVRLPSVLPAWPPGGSVVPPESPGLSQEAKGRIKNTPHL